ncbi:TetR family transcriptional regulator [Roseateles puraquae]|uniref:TetR family transcriptional regulator n=2 Tax=Roseateles puraquae TaxID=431059 RepID=A0A254N9S2_9BURK|nr:TetR family transcriptional regulator [Roseateles puraquae]
MACFRSFGLAQRRWLRISVLIRTHKFFFRSPRGVKEKRTMPYCYGGSMRVMTDERRADIIRLTALLFEQLGYEATSMSEISRRLGGSKSTLYRYFPTKDDLVVAVVKTFVTAHMADAIAELEKGIERGLSLQQVLLRFGEQALKVVANDSRARSLHRVIVASAGQSNVGELFFEAGPAQMQARLTELIEHAVRRGEIQPVDPPIAAQQFTALLNAQVSGRIYQQNPRDLKPAQLRPMAMLAVDFFLSALMPNPPSAAAGSKGPRQAAG